MQLCTPLWINLLESLYYSGVLLSPTCKINYVHMQFSYDQRRTPGAPPTLLFEIFWGFVFVNFDSITRIYFNCTIMLFLQYVLCSLLSLQNIGYVWRGHKNKSQTLGNLPHRDRRPPPPFLKFPDPPLMTTCNIIMFTCVMIYLAYSKTDLEVCNSTYLYMYMYITGAKPALGLNCMIPYINLIFIHVYGVIQFGPNILPLKIQAKG